MKSAKGKNTMTKGEVTRRQESALLLHRAKILITQRIFSGAAIVLVGLMIFNTMKMTMADTTGTSNLNLTVGAGTLAIMNVGTDVQFLGGVAGVASNVFQNLMGTTVRDFSAGAGNWDLNVYSEPMNGVTDPAYFIPNTAIGLWSINATKTNVETFTVANLGNGVQNLDLNGDDIFFNSDAGTTGAVRIDNILFKVNMNASLSPQAYRGDITMTVVAS